MRLPISQKINDFSSDVSEAALSLGTEIVVPNSESQGKDSVDLIRDSLFPFKFNNLGYSCNLMIPI